MKTLLFTQTGDARPKCLGSVAIGGPRGEKYIDSGDSCYLSDYQSFLLGTADRWWLVECENAEAGRIVIADVAARDAGEYVMGITPGRILARGGRAA